MASTNGKVAKQSTFAGRRVRGYRRPLDNYYLLHPALREGQFSLYDVPAMMMDDTILIGLSAIYGAISGATFEVRANSPEIKTFVENTLFRFWHHDLSKLLHHYVPWGTFAGEAMYEQDIDSGLWRYAGVDDFDVRDVQPWKRGRHLSKIRVSPGGMGVIEPEGYKRTEEDPTEWNVVRAPKIFWVAHRPLCGNLRGHSAFEASWGPWMEKCGTHGAISIRRLWAFANAFRGVIVKYPEGFTEREDGTQISNADIAREIAENWTTGGASICPSAKDENGNPLWEIIDAKMNGDIASMLEYPKDLNRAILRGMGVLDEVITAPDVGGSWSGRSGPLLIFLNSCDFRVKEIVTGFDVGPSGYTTRSEQSGGIIRPLVIENFGPKAKYEIRPISLVPKPAEPGAGGTGGAPGLPPGLPPGPGSPMGPPPGQMDVPTQPAGGNPIKLSGADDGSVELPDAEVEAILSGDVQLSAIETPVAPVENRVKPQADDNSTEDLANLYAHMWHGLTPEEVGEKELGTVHDELADGEHHLHWNSKVGWHVKHTSEDSDVQMSTKHAPKGGIVIAGKVFRGGMFIPNEDYQKATPEEKAAIDNPKEARADVRKARGSINHDTLQEKLAAHAHHELTKQELTSAKRSFNALHRHHGDLVLHRLEEIADMLQAAHDREGNTEGQTEQYSRRLKAVQHQIDFAKKINLQGQVSVESQEKARAAHELAKSSKRSNQERLPSGQPVGDAAAQDAGEGSAGTGEGTGGRSASVPSGDDEQRDGVRGKAAGPGDAAGSSEGSNDGSTPESRSVLNQTAEEESLTEPPTPENPTDLSFGNFRYTSRDFFKGGMKAKFAANVEAIRTLKAIQLENRTATAEEQQTMSRYVGWGQFPAVFNDYYDDKTPYQEKERLKATLSPEEFDARFNYSAWHKEKAILRSLLTDEEWASARRSTLNAHYTHPDVIDAHWKMAEKLGFKGGKFLETSAGIGYYMGLMPSHLAGKTGCSAVEMDELTGGMLKHLYPSANVNVQGFQDFKSPDNFYDLVASNVPFGDYKVHDKDYNKHNANIHDYFFLKSLDKVRPGGLVMHITSSGTLDKSDSSIRKALAEGCELVSAIRFPSGAHKENAGTEVVTDMLILRKKHAGEGPEDLNVTPQEAAPAKAKFTGTTVDSLGRLYHWKDGVRVPGPNWMDIASVPDPDGKEAIPVNKYFADHPEQVLGRLDRSGTMYQGDSVNVSKSDDYEKRLQDAINRLPEGVLTKARRSNKQFEPESLPAPGDVKNGGYKIQDGKLFVRDGGAIVAQQVNKKGLERIEAHLAVRDAVRAVLNDQIAGRDATDARAKLNSVYDQFVKKFGILNDRANRCAFKSDPDAPVLLAIEKHDPKKGTAEKADIFTKDTIRAVPTVEKAGTVSEALSVSLHESGGIDLARMSKLLGKSEAAIANFLVEKGLAFNSPGEGWKPADQYLSGNVRKKLAIARAALSADPSFAANVKALEAIQPADIDHSEIDVKLGVPWIPATDVAEFAANLLQGNPDQFTIGYNATSGAWNADYSKDGQRFLSRRQLAREVWATNRKTFDELLEAALNNTPVTVSDKDSEGNSIVNKKETDDANAKVQEIKDAFKNWVWEDDARRERLHRFYNDNFNNIVPMKYDGSHQTFPGMNPAIQLRDHQKSFVWQVVTTGKGLAAHEVGTGKTYSMITAAMELRRLGLAKKPAIACLKANIEAITNDALKLYPGARIISTADMFDAASRKKTISRIATGDYDMVILTHDNMDMLQMKPETVRKYIEEEIAELEAAKLEAHKENPKKDNRIVKDLEKAKQNLEAKLKEALDESTKDDAVFFEETGIDHLFVDEAHKYKTLPCYTKQRGLKGIPTGRSDRATSMLMRTRWLMEGNNGRGVTFATGTPVANTMAELYNMQRYLQPEELKERGINAFDAWAKTFGDVQTKMEFTVSGQYKPVSRFAKFTNIPELMQMTGQVIDVQRADDLKKDDGSAAIIRPKRKDAVVAAPKSETMEKLMKSLQERAGKLKGKAEKGSDNMLVICTDGRKGAIDMRMLDASAPDDPNSKTNLAVNNVLDIHKKTPGVTQLIFSDIGVNPTDQGFHLYGDIINKLVEGGIPREKIADFSVLEGAKKEAAMEAMRKGEILVGIGSTEKMGTGVNVQDKLKALHHLDVPWVPASLEQRDGRGWRQGNENKDVDIVRYVSEGSLDQTFWQIIGNKTRFIKQVMSGKTNPGMRVAAEEDSEELTPDQLMAAASGDPRILEKVNLDEDLRNLRAAENRHVREQTKLRDAVKRGQSSIEDLQRRASEFQAISKHLEDNPQEDFSIEIGGKQFKDRKEASEAFKSASDSAAGQYGKQLIGSYRGMKIYKNPNEKKLWLQTPSGERIDTGDALGSVEYVVRNHSKSLEGAHTDVAKASSDLEKLKTNIGKPFAKSEELKAKMERSAALEAELAKKVEEEKPAEPNEESA